jgi:broad specificity phosphatase PhoE
VILRLPQQQLKREKIRYVYSTNTQRTRSTAAPVAAYFRRPIMGYSAIDGNLLKELRGLQGNALIVAHSNTVDDLVNGLTGQQLLSDLPDSVYNKLFIVERKGKQFRCRVADQNVPVPLPQQ